MLVHVIDESGKVEKFVPDDQVEKFKSFGWTVDDDTQGPDTEKKRGRPRKETE
jgi:transketolase